MFNYLFLSETYEPVARDTCPPPPFGKILKSWIFSIELLEACIQIWSVLTSYGPFYLRNIFWMVTRHALSR
jgi:hypothetical protein